MTVADALLEPKTRIGGLDLVFDELIEARAVSSSDSHWENRYSYDEIASDLLNAFNQQTSTFQQLPSPQVTTTYAYDNNGNLLTETTGSNIKAYAWDVDNRLRQLSLPSGGGTHTYEYDAAGLRTKQVTPTGTTRYQSIEGYILENPVDGTGAYRIGGALNGGACDGSNASSGPGEGCPSCSASSAPAGSTVNLATGNLREEWTDLSLPAVGLPIVFARHYASRAAALTPMGYGWMHSYGMFLRPEVAGAYTLVTDDWREVRFTPGSGGTFTSSPGWHIQLTAVAGGFKARMKDGLTYEFDSAGSLMAISEPSGNRTALVYASGLLTQVKDSSGQVALALSYTGSKLTNVMDRAGRSISFTFNGDDLASATDVLGKTEAYGYDGLHNLN